MIEDLYYNGGNGLVGSKTRFYKNIEAYLDTSDPQYLEEALIEVRERSNRERLTNPSISRGIQNRRNVQAAMGDSQKCPVYSKPCEQALPSGKKIRADINSTIIPRKHGSIKEDSIKSDRFYIWRTVGDNRVRSSHASNEGKIFDVNNPPPTGNPGDDYNCRCSADFYIPNYVEIDGHIKNRNLSQEHIIIRKYIKSFEELPNFMTKNN